MKFLKNVSILLGILFLGLLLRLWNINWDMGYHLHPDERAIILYSLPLEFPSTIEQFFSLTSPWNPHFFAYGSFPLYLLKILGSLGAIFSASLGTYENIHIIGRIISGLFDLGTCITLYFLTKKLFSKNLALLASFFYAISVLPIQLSHFYAVDTILTFFIIFLLYQLIKFYEHPTKRKAIGIGILLGFALATKTSAFPLLFSVYIAISLDFFLLFIKQPHKIHIWSPHVPLFFRRLLTEGLLIFIAAITTFFLLEPYAFIDSEAFLTQTIQQSAMTKSAFTFPYTLQYVGKIAYIYEIKNIILWGMGPILGISALLGIVFYHKNLLKNNSSFQQGHILLLSFFWVYFLLVGNFAIGFMRYMLPLYPFFCLFSAYLIFSIFLYLRHKHPLFLWINACIFFILLCLWPLSFMHIYQTSPTRVLATNWILQSIPFGKTIALEHWDDGLPLSGQENYVIETLELYNPDSREKWSKIDEQIAKSDYIIIASNRLYTPLQKLTDCTHIPYLYCYTKTAQYYKKLFSGHLGFTKVAEFSVYPTLPFIQTPIEDSSADESFTVYDHPKVIIFKKDHVPL